MRRADSLFADMFISLTSHCKMLNSLLIIHQILKQTEQANQQKETIFHSIDPKKRLSFVKTFKENQLCVCVLDIHITFEFAINFSVLHYKLFCKNNIIIFR